MPCYPCNHCNKCGIFSLRLELTCRRCGADVVAGEKRCVECGEPYTGNTRRGKIGKPEDAQDYYTKMDEEFGADPYRLTDMSDLD